MSRVCFHCYELPDSVALAPFKKNVQRIQETNGLYMAWWNSFLWLLTCSTWLALDIWSNYVPAIILFPVVCIPAGDASVHTTSIPSLDLIKVLLLSSQYSQERPNSLGHWWVFGANALANHLKLTAKMAKQVQTGHFKFWSLPISLSLNLPISIANCYSQGFILWKITNSSIPLGHNIHIKLGEDLSLSLHGTPISALYDLNCITAIFFATYKLAKLIKT